MERKWMNVMTMSSLILLLVFVSYTNAQAGAVYFPLSATELVDNNTSITVTVQTSEPQLFFFDVPLGANNYTITLSGASNQSVYIYYNDAVPPVCHFADNSSIEFLAAVPFLISDKPFFLSFPMAGRWYFYLYNADDSVSSTFSLSLEISICSNGAFTRQCNRRPTKIAFNSEIALNLNTPELHFFQTTLSYNQLPPTEIVVRATLSQYSASNSTRAIITNGPIALVRFATTGSTGNWATSPTNGLTNYLAACAVWSAEIQPTFENNYTVVWGCNLTMLSPRQGDYFISIIDETESGYTFTLTLEAVEPTIIDAPTSSQLSESSDSSSSEDKRRAESVQYAIDIEGVTTTVVFFDNRTQASDWSLFGKKRAYLISYAADSSAALMDTLLICTPVGQSANLFHVDYTIYVSYDSLPSPTYYDSYIPSTYESLHTSNEARFPIYDPVRIGTYYFLLTPSELDHSVRVVGSDNGPQTCPDEDSSDADVADAVVYTLLAVSLVLLAAVIIAAGYKNNWIGQIARMFTTQKKAINYAHLGRDRDSTRESDEEK